MNQYLPSAGFSQTDPSLKIDSKLSISILGLLLLPAFTYAGESEGMTWLKSHTNSDSRIANALQSQQEVLQGLNLLNQSVSTSVDLAALLQDEHSTELLARAAIVAKLQQQNPSIYLTELKAAQNEDGGFGHLEGWQSNPLDTAFVLLALKETQFIDGLASTSEKQQWQIIRSKALDYLKTQQRADGSYQVSSLDKLYVSAYVLNALSKNVAIKSDISTNVIALVSFLENAQINPGQWSSNPQGLFIDALVAEALHPFHDASHQGVETAFRQRILSQQQSNGSWLADPYTTALILRSLKTQSAVAVNPVTSGIQLQVIDAETGLPVLGVALTSITPSLNQTSDINGQIAIASAPAGQIRFSLQREGYAGMQFDITLRQGEQLNLGQIKLSRAINATTAQIQGKVLDRLTGAGVGGALVTVVMLDNNGQPVTPQTVLTGNDGSYQVLLSQGGSFGIDIRKDGYAPVQGNGSVPNGNIAVFSPKLNTISNNVASAQGKVVDGQGQPLAGVSILEGSAVVATTDLQGLFSITNIQAGSKQWLISTPGYLQATVSVGLQAGQNLDIGTITLPAQTVSNDPNVPTPTTVDLGQISVKAIDQRSGTLISGIGIDAELLDSQNNVVQHQNFSATEDNINLATLTIPVGKWRITVKHPAYQTLVRTFDVTKDQNIIFDATLTLVPYNILGAVIDSQSNQGVAGAEVRVIDNRTNALIQKISADGAGAFKFTNITATQDIRVEVESAQYLSTTRYFDRELESASTVDLGNIRIRPKAADIVLPDLVLADLDSSALQYDIQKLTVQGEIQTSVINKGNIGANRSVNVTAFKDNNFDGVLNDNDVVLGEATVRLDIDPASSQSIVIPVKGNSDFRNAPIAVMIDSKQEFVERNENNNVRTTLERSLQSRPLDLTQTKNLTAAWTLENESMLTSPLVESFWRTDNTGRIKETKGLFYIDSRGALKAVDGATGAVLWSHSLGLIQNYSGLIDKLVIATDQSEKRLFVTDSSRKKILEYKLSGELVSSIDVPVTRASASDQINFFYADGILNIFTEDGIYSVKDKSWKLFEESSQITRQKGGLTSFFSYLFAKNMILANGILYDTNGHIVKDATGAIPFKPVVGSSGNNSFAVADFDGDGEVDIASKTCTSSSGSSQLDVYSLKKKASLFRLSGANDCRFKEDITVADFTGDNRPDIFYAGRLVRNDGSIAWQINRQDYESFQASAFDFNMDGRYEVVLNRLSGLKILNGVDSRELWKFDTRTGANSPNPIIADVNGDQITDILLPSSSSACTDPMRFEESPLAGSDVKVLIRWAGGSDLDTNTTFNNIRYGWNFPSTQYPYIRWLGDNTSGGPEYVYLNSTAASAAGVTPNNEVKLQIGAAWYSGYDANNNWAQVEVSTKDGRCFSGYLNSIRQSVSVRNPDYQVSIPLDGSEMKVTDMQGNAVAAVSNTSKLTAIHGNSIEWGGARGFWNSQDFNTDRFTDEGNLINKQEFYPNMLRANKPVEYVKIDADLTTSYLRFKDSGIFSPSQLTARIGNAGGKDVAVGAPVSFYRIPPAVNGIAGQPVLIKTVTLTQPLLAGHYQDITVDYAGDMASFGELVVVANDAGAGLDSLTGIPLNAPNNSGVVQEYTRANNLARLTFGSGFQSYSLDGLIDKTSYGVGDTVSVTAIPSNLGSLPSDVIVKARIVDSAGNVVATLADQTASLAGSLLGDGSNSKTLQMPWAVGQSRTGSYRVVIELVRDGWLGQETVATVERSFNVVSNASAVGLTANAVQVDKTQYQAGDTVNITSRLQNTASNEIATTRTVTLELVDPNAQIIWTQTSNYDPLAPNALIDKTFPVVLKQAIAGSYSIRSTQHAMDGSQADQTVTRGFNVLSSTQSGVGIGGQIQSAATVEVGKPIQLDWQLSNQSNIALNNINTRIILIDADTGNLIGSPIGIGSQTLATGTSTPPQTVQWTSVGTPEQRIMALLQVELDKPANTVEEDRWKTVANTSFKLTVPPLKVSFDEAQKTAKPLLVYYSCHEGWWDVLSGWILGRYDYGCFDERERQVKTYLDRINVPYSMVREPWQFRDRLHSGVYGQYWLLGAVEQLSPHTYKEVRESAYLGDNLLADNGLLSWQNANLLALAGVRYRGRIQLSEGAITPQPANAGLPPLLTKPDSAELSTIPLQTTTARRGQSFTANWPVLLEPLTSYTQTAATFDAAKKLGIVIEISLEIGAKPNSYFHTLQNYPAVATAPYGRGRPVALAFDLPASLTLANGGKLPVVGTAPTASQKRWDYALTELLANRQAIARSSYVSGEPVQVPITLDNQSNQERTIQIDVELPSGSSWLGRQGGTQTISAAAQAQAKISYQFKVAANSKSTELIALRLPGTSGTHVVRTTVSSVSGTGSATSTTLLDQQENRYLVRSLDERLALLKQSINGWNSSEGASWLELSNLKTDLLLLDKYYRYGQWELAILQAGHVSDDLASMQSAKDSRIVSNRIELDEFLRGLQIRWYLQRNGQRLAP